MQGFLFRLVGFKGAEGMVDKGVEHIVFVLKQAVVHLPGQPRLPADVTDGDIVVIVLEGQPQEGLLQKDLIFGAFFRNAKLIHTLTLLALARNRMDCVRTETMSYPDAGAQGRYTAVMKMITR